MVLYKIDSKVSKGQQRSAKRISGIIRDLSGVPIIGASIAVENGAGGTISDLNGKFSLNAHEKRLADDFVHRFRQEGTESEEGLLRNYAGRGCQSS